MTPDRMLPDPARRLVCDAYLDGSADADLDGMLSALMGSPPLRVVAAAPPVAVVPVVPVPVAAPRPSLLRRVVSWLLGAS